MGDGKRPGDVEFRLLGPVQAIVDGQPVELGPAKRRLLLALLLLECGRRVPLDRIIELLWDEPPPAARRVVFAHVARLRRALAGARRYGVELVTSPPGYELRADPELVDAYRFRRLVDAARGADGPVARVARLREALALWRGPVLDGLAAGPGVARLVHGLHELGLSTVEDRLDGDLALGRHAEVVVELTELTGRHPVRERLAGQLMLALYRCGRTAESLAVYRRTRAQLATELGVDPGPDLDAMHAAVLRRDPALAPPPVSVPSDLPPAVAGLVGRDEQLGRLDGLLPADPARAVVAVTGLTGVGKTALAVHWAHRVADRFPGGRYYVDLAGPGPAPPTPGTDRVLVVLDNATSAEQVRPLLPAGRGSLAVVVSRCRLDGLIAVDRANHLPLGLLSEPAALRLLAGFIGADRMAAEPGAAADLVRLCGRLPLAVGFVGAQLNGYPDRTLRAQVGALDGGDPLSVLATDDGERAAIRAAFTDSLPADLRATFRRVSLYPGRTVSPPAAAALAGTDVRSAYCWLARLGRYHLVEPVDGDRYQVNDLLRLFAGEVAGDDREAALDRLADWYLPVVDAAGRRLYPQLIRLPVGGEKVVFDSDAAARRWLDAERDNIVAVVERLADSARPDAAWLLADAMRGPLQDGRHLDALLATARAGYRAAREAPVRVRATMRLGLATAIRYRGDVLATMDLYHDALELCRAAAWPDGEAAAHGSLGNLNRTVGAFDLAAHHYEQSLRHFRRTGHRRGMAVTLGHLGAVYRLSGRLAEAADAQAEARAV